MKLQMAAIVLVSAMLGGVFGVAVWRAIDKRDVASVPAQVASSKTEPERFWFCIYLGKGEDPFTTCFRRREECDGSPRPMGHSCLVSLYAWCGKNPDEPCTLEQELCEAQPGNVPVQARVAVALSPDRGGLSRGSPRAALS